MLWQPCTIALRMAITLTVKIRAAGSWGPEGGEMDHVVCVYGVLLLRCTAVIKWLL
jgi:hypothetical protein